MTLVTGQNFFPKIYGVTKKEDHLRYVPHEMTFDLGQLTLNVCHCLTELTDDHDDVVTPVNLCLSSCTGFVDNVVSVNE